MRIKNGNSVYSIAFFISVIYNSLMLAEMVLLGFIARRIYKRILPEDDRPNTQSHISTIGAIMAAEFASNNNNINCTNNNKAPVGFTNAALEVNEK